MDPTKTPLKFFENVINIAETLGNNSLIICGDFNAVQDTKLDYSNYKQSIIRKLTKYFRNKMN